MIRPWLRSLPGWVKVFLATIGLAGASFFALFAVFLPLVYEHSLISYRFSAGYVWNFFFSLSLYFVIAACLAVIIYICMRNARPEIKIFVITFFTTFWGIVGTGLTSSLYWGTPGHPWIVIIMWQGWLAGVIFARVSLYLLAMSVFAVLAYRVYRFVHGTARIFLSLFVAAFLSAFICISVMIPLVSLGSLLLELLFSYCISLTIATLFNKRLRDTLEGRKQKK